jgi:anti-sigma regulatory factor (Ser/Thr protein kinase)
MSNIVYRDAQKIAIRFLIKPSTPFQVILKFFSEIRYPDTEIADEQITFAILELVSNSIRAHQERKTEESVIVEFHCEETALKVAIQDTGGGFDPKGLPYSFDEPVSSLDMMSPAFISYRERHDFQRFGMGLVAVRKVFPRFRLAFIDSELKPVDWPSNNIVGTRIDLELPLGASLLEEL